MKYKLILFHFGCGDDYSPCPIAKCARTENDCIERGFLHQFEACTNMSIFNKLKSPGSVAKYNRNCNLVEKFLVDLFMYLAC